MVFFRNASVRSLASVCIFEWSLAGTAAAAHTHPKPCPEIPHTKERDTYMNKTLLGEYIRERRQGLRMSQRELARRIGLNAASHLCDVENGFRQIGEEYLPKLAEVLEVSLVDLQDHDPRAPFSKAQELFEKDPQYIVALHRVVREARHLKPEEIIRRIEQKVPDADPVKSATQTPPPGNT
jgi:transcriptional regulator with XRE-family HTH domain